MPGQLSSFANDKVIQTFQAADISEFIVVPEIQIRHGIEFIIPLRCSPVCEEGVVDGGIGATDNIGAYQLFIRIIHYVRVSLAVFPENAVDIGVVILTH